MPRGFLSYPQVACDFIAADSVLTGDDQPHGKHPLVHAQRGILENTGNLDGELFLASLAKPETASADI